MREGRKNMKKKIVAIVLVGMFSMTGIMSLTALSVEEETNLTVIAEEKSATIDPNDPWITDVIFLGITPGIFGKRCHWLVKADHYFPGNTLRLDYRKSDSSGWTDVIIELSAPATWEVSWLMQFGSYTASFRAWFGVYSSEIVREPYLVPLPRTRSIMDFPLIARLLLHFF